MTQSLSLRHNSVASLRNMASFETYDYVVVGLGGHGSATLAQIAQSFPESKVLGIEQFTMAHGQGMS